MADFKVIETQEQLDAVIGERLTRQKEKLETSLRESLTNEYQEKYSDYDALKEAQTTSAEQIEKLKASLKEANDKFSESGTEIESLKSTIAKYESDSVKTRVAMEMGIPYEMASRLSGTTEEEIRADAQKISELFSQSKAYIPPMASTEPKADVDGVMAAFRKLNPNIKF